MGKVSRSSKRRVSLAVRNIMFNELGFSRDSVRGMIAQEVANLGGEFTRNEDRLRAILEGVIERAVYGRYRTGQLKKDIEAATKKHIDDLVKKRVDDILATRLRVTIESEAKRV